MRKVLALVLGFFLTGLLLAPYGAALPPINSANTIIVLPTTKIVNGTPLHIGEDAITGSRLGAFLVLQGITTGTYTSKVSVPVEYHSVPVADENQTYRLNRRDMPDVGINVSDEPVGRAIVIQVNFSRVYFNSTKRAAEFLDRSVEIIFNENTTPLDIGGDYKVVSTIVDGKDTMYFYSYTEVKDASGAIGDTLTVGDWAIEFQDINLNQREMLVDIHYPSGELRQKLMEEGRYYIMYVDSRGNEDFEPFDSYPETRIRELLETGVKNLFVFTPKDFFVGIGGTRSVIYDYWYYEKVRQYQDGEVYRGQWVWDIDPAENLFILYLHVNTSAGFHRVFVGAGKRLELPTDWGLALEPLFIRNKDGKITGVKAYRFVRTVMISKVVSITAPRVQATDDVYSFIINDTALKSIPANRNVIIVGGWISNRAWDLLEKVYGEKTVENIKKEVMSRGYVVKILDNPSNPRYKVIILAGKTYSETRKAVDEFMKSL
ncbi:S-layer protein [Thermococcus sp.]|uniref:S-layer protein n=1 Tax=Thermococcus sp. TaxID=35749 RepID=UPI00263063DC|nr:S-layer protein [Thermococcus sp.]